MLILEDFATSNNQGSCGYIFAEYNFLISDFTALCSIFSFYSYTLPLGLDTSKIEWSFISVSLHNVSMYHIITL